MKHTRIVVTVAVLLLSLGSTWAAGIPPFPTPPVPEGQLRSCVTNLAMMGAALEMYAMDHGGTYPEKLSQLAPAYLKSIPHCAAAGEDTYSIGYRVQDNQWTLVCTGHHHDADGVPDGFPRYLFTQGIEIKPGLFYKPCDGDPFWAHFAPGAGRTATPPPSGGGGQ
ncbi:MAG: hypothetical protein ACYCW6_08990 [Candidatus Xenobia bacterium]